MHVSQSQCNPPMRCLVMQCFVDTICSGPVYSPIYSKIPRLSCAGYSGGYVRAVKFLPQHNNFKTTTVLPGALLLQRRVYLFPVRR